MKNIWPTKRNLIFKVSGKTVAKSLAEGVVQLAILCIYIRMIVYDSATVNIVKKATVKTILSAFHLHGPTTKNKKKRKKQRKSNPCLRGHTKIV